jgi:hypothetical protein
MQLRWLLAILTLIAAITLCSGCNTSAPVLTDVIADGKAKAKATFDGTKDGTGDTGSSATISLSFTNDGLRVCIPAGTILYASDRDSQRLITAKSVIVAGASGDNTVQVPTYCLDEFRTTPSPQSQLSFEAPDGGDSENTEALKQLVDCLASSSLSAQSKQLIIWSVSAKLFGMSQSDALTTLTNRITERTMNEQRAKLEANREHMRSNGSPDAEIDELFQQELEAEGIGQMAKDKAEAQIKEYVRNRDVLVGCGCANDSDPIFQ